VCFPENSLRDVAHIAVIDEGLKIQIKVNWMAQNSSRAGNQSQEFHRRPPGILCRSVFAARFPFLQCLVWGHAPRVQASDRVSHEITTEVVASRPLILRCYSPLFKSYPESTFSKYLMISLNALLMHWFPCLNL
jgi:hypothetical protein